MSCPDCFSGHKHNSTPTGNVTQIHGRQTYVAEPPNGTKPKGIIIIVPDAFGLPFVNNKLLADHYASGGDYLVYLPDFMDGSVAPEWMMNVFPGLLKTGSVSAYLSKPYYVFLMMRGMVPFLIRNRFGASYPKVKKFFDDVRCNEGKDLPIGVAGFCWGGKHAFLLAGEQDKAANGKPLLDSAFTGHPSALDIPADIEKVKLPMAIAIGTKDIMLYGEKLEQTKKILDEKKFKTEVQVYKGAGHGFCVRADPTTEDAVRQAKEAEEQAVSWFKRTLVKVET